MLDSKASNEEDERLLSDAESFAHEPRELLHRRRTFPWLILSALFNILLTTLCLLLYLRPISYPSPFPQQIYSPAQDALEYKTVVFHSNAASDSTPYQGPPSEEVDAAWDVLYRHVGISQIDEESARQLPNQTAPLLAGSSQYIVGLDVFHQLHCLNMIRKSLYPEYYGGHPLGVKANGSYQAEIKWQNDWHIAHCIDSIRQSLMCSIDVSTISWTWIPESNLSAPDARTTHTCRDWDRVYEWAVEHKLRDKFDETAAYPARSSS
ncbi:hypothetical protein G7Y89_g2625 [Cudoniella acicularis]|uniref:Tat pathway signal sequence n=1 Tax=Cudoniella acicularis TaxID=354080 RepID=A0A8H4RU51_9HELO|nr:hypothetical protein G7Y89_g2625 [Cudoniella acicularis]